jgi:hypothetical protein
MVFVLFPKFAGLFRELPQSWSGAWHADVQETLGLAMSPSQEEKSHTNGAQEITKSMNRWNLCLPTSM